MDIKSLPSDVRKRLRSGVNINSVTQCVIELVLNSLDAKSTAIAIRVNLLKFRIQVVDNGTGITKSNMHSIGIRYMTNKCHSTADLKKIKHFGFRGEALASIRGLSRTLAITSRIQNVENSYSKTYANGKWSAVEAAKCRPSSGTTVTVEGFMYNLPVRQKRINENLDLNKTKQSLEGLAIIYPNVSFSLRNDVTGKMLIQSKQTKTVSQALVNLYPAISIDDLMEMKVIKNNTSISGLIYKKPYAGSKLQLIYLNKRPINSPKIQKLANSLLLKSRIFQKTPQILRDMVFSAPLEKTEHPLYVINIRCPYSKVDLTLSPSKKTIEFKHWDVVLKCISKAITKLLEQENLINPTAIAEQINNKDPVNNQGFQSPFGVSQIHGAITSRTFKRKAVDNIVEHPNKLSKTDLNYNSDTVVEFVNNSKIREGSKEGQPTERITFGLGNKIPNDLENDKMKTKTNKCKKLKTKVQKGKIKGQYNEYDTSNILVADSKNAEREAEVNFKEKTVTENWLDNFLSHENENNMNFFKDLEMNSGKHRTNRDNRKDDISNLHLDYFLNINNHEERLNHNNNVTVIVKDPNLRRSVSNDMNSDLLNDLKLKKSRNKAENNPLAHDNRYFKGLNVEKKPVSIFDKYTNTQSLVLNSEFDSSKQDDNPLLNNTINTTTLNNQDQGKDLIMDMFLKSTLIYPHEEPEITENNNAIKTVVVTTTNQNLVTERKNQNTTMTMSLKVMSKKTIVTNSMYVLHNGNENRVNNDKQSKLQINLKKNQVQPPETEENPTKVNGKMISKCIQTTMVEQQKELNLNFNYNKQEKVHPTAEFSLPQFSPQNEYCNATFSKYFRKLNRTKHRRNMAKHTNHRPFSNGITDAYNVDQHLGNLNFQLYNEITPNCQSNRPVVHFGSHRLNAGNIPCFGSTNYFLRPMNIADNHAHNYDFLNYNYSNNFRNPIRRYVSDYNFDFSSMNVLDDPYKKFLRQQNFLGQTNHLPVRKKSYYQWKLENSCYNRNIITNNVPYNLSFNSHDATIPLYKSYNPRRFEWNELFQEPTNNLFSYNATAKKPQYYYNNIMHTNHRHQNVLYNEPNNINSEFLFKRTNESSNFILPIQNKELQESILRDYQDINKNLRPQSENILPKINVTFLQPEPNYKVTTCKSTDFKSGVLSGLEEKCYSPFFPGPNKRNNRQKHQHCRTKYNFTRKISGNRDLLKKKHRVIASPFFCKTSESGRISEARRNRRLNDLLSNVANDKRETRSPFFLTNKHQQHASSNRILNVSQRQPRHQPFFIPEQNFASNQNQYRFTENYQSNQNEELSGELCQQQTLHRQYENTIFLETSSLRPKQHCPENNETMCENDKNIQVYIMPSKCGQQHDRFRLQKKQEEDNSKFIATNENSFCRKNEFLQRKFNKANFQQNFSKISPFLNISRHSLQLQPEPRHIHQKESSLKRFPTEPCFPNFLNNYRNEPITGNYFNCPSQASQFSNFIHERNKDAEYSFTTPNINMSNTDDNNKQIDLDLTENSCELLNSSLCSNNFKPALSSTRFEAIEQSRNELNVFVPENKSDTQLNTVIVEATPTSFHDFPIFSLIPMQGNAKLNKPVDYSKHNKLNIEVFGENETENCFQDKGHQNNKSCRESWSPLNISVNTMKKVNLIETELKKDCQLNKNSESDGSEQLDVNLAIKNNCNLIKYQCDKASTLGNHEFVDLQTVLENEWIRKVNTFGSTFYINKRTGMTSMYSPKQDTNFNFTKRYAFVPKGLSPIFVESKKVEVLLSPTSKKSLHEAILKSYENELNTVKWENYIQNYEDVGKFFEELYKEKMKQLQYFVPNMAANKLPRSMIKLCKNVQAQSFTKDIFSDLDIIGQLDSKFIITFFKSQKLILLFDQHAVHERVRLEKLLDEYKELGNQEHTVKFKSTKCQEKITLHFLEEDLNVMEKYKSSFIDSGLSYEIKKNLIEVTHIPTCICNKFLRSNHQTNVSLKNVVTSLIYEHINMITSTRGVASKMPTVLQNIINSEACRGAIKFGEILTHDECVKHLEWLAECKLPFQCAHGRPTLTPVVSLNQELFEEKLKPNLNKLRV